MAHWLASRGDAGAFACVKRFDPLYWTVNFPRPMMASVVSASSAGEGGPHGMRVDCTFYRTDDLAGLIWEAEDKRDHPLLAYETARDFRECVLAFDWASTGLMPLDTVNGPTLTIEGRDAKGQPASWYVRLWNYASGTPTAASVRIDFAAVQGGFSLPGEAVAVWAGDVDRMFVSLVPPGYTGTPGMLARPVEASVIVSNVRCDGAGSVLSLGDGQVPEHKLRMATGYDDLYHLNPARVVRNIKRLGYARVVNHYVGMSHYFRLEALGEGLYVSIGASAINAPCAAWHRGFADAAKAAGFEIIWSLSYELLDQHCWGDWKQRSFDGAPALTGWEPPSTLLSPAHEGAMAYLRAVALAFVGIASAAAPSTGSGQARVRFQVGEPWWWVNPGGRICLYDDAAKAKLSGPVIADVRGQRSAGEIALLDAAGAMLARSTAALVAAVKGAAPGAEALVLVYLPSVLDAEAPEVVRANVPRAWAAPAFDVLQCEDYDWAAAGRSGASARGLAAMKQRLGYPDDKQHYFAGFVLRPEDRAQWGPIARAAAAGFKRGVAETFVWALPQVMRDGFTWFEPGGDEAMQAFDDVRFPIAIGRRASVAPSFSTAVVATASGAEQRNADWSDARMRYDAGPGVRSEVELGTLIAFFRARRGAAKAFRFEDPYDSSSNGMTGPPGAGDQRIGTGDGTTTRFALVKRYGDGVEAQVRSITRPVAGSVRVAIGGVARGAGWRVDGGAVEFDMAPAGGAAVTAGFRFDVPVRFAEDRLEVNAAAFAAGEAVSVPLVEVRE